MRSFIFKSILTFFIILTLVQSEKNSTFVHNSVARYHIEFVNGNSDSVYQDLLRSNLKYTPAD